MFHAVLSDGEVAEGEYVDLWTNDSQWRREASVGTSRYIRTGSGEQRYQLAEGPDSGILRLILKVMEPIPAVDSFVESDWKIKRDTIGEQSTFRLLAGYESPAGKLDPQQARAYWFNERGLLLRTYFKGVETRRSDFEAFGNFQVATSIEVLLPGGGSIPIHVTDVSAAEALPSDTFKLPGHQWTRAFTDETR